MHNAGLAPPPEAANQKLYTMLMTALAKRWRQDEALQVFERMQAAGVRPNAITYNAIVSAVRARLHYPDGCRTMSIGCREAGVPPCTARGAG